MPGAQKMTGGPFVSPQIALLTISVLKDKGISEASFFERLPFEKDKLYGENARITFQEMFEVFETAVDLSQTPWLGLDVGRAETVRSWGALGYAIMSCASEIEAAALGSRYNRAAPSLLHTRTQVVGDRLRLQLDPIYPLGRLLVFCIEENISGICTVSSEYLNEPMVPLEISVTYPKPDHSAHYDEAFGCPVLYDQPMNVFWTRAPSDQPLRTTDPAVAKVCLDLVEDIVAQNEGEDGFLSDMRRMLLKTPGRLPGMEDIAAELAMSSRTLRRRLLDLGTSFRQLQDEVRRDVAVDYLKNTDLQVDQIAHLLGYSETTNFRRAFKQWTGQPPRTYRNQSHPF
ncbi:AraC family transcriptional regulator [Pyruvatibacter sp.]|uniref:AraC family transcriptional regulator n=1 Tax=Pyruvatibacter sp. TaxID=1981328 RepID=UPI0032652841